MAEQQAIDYLQRDYIQTSNELRDLTFLSKYQAEQLEFFKQRLSEQEQQSQAEIGEILLKTEMVIDKLEAEKNVLKENFELASEKIGQKESEINDLHREKLALWVKKRGATSFRDGNKRKEVFAFWEKG